MPQVRPGDTVTVSPGTTRFDIRGLDVQLATGSTRTIALTTESRLVVTVQADGSLRWQPGQVQMSESQRQIAEAERRIAATVELRRVQYEQQQAQLRQASAWVHELLTRLLTAEQRAEYDRRSTFTVRGSAGGLYRLAAEISGGIRVLDPATEEQVAAFCAHPADAGSMPVAATQLGQMLALQVDEPAFMATACMQWDNRAGQPQECPCCT